MIAACPECRTQYRVDPQRLTEEGVRLRCARCETVFRVRSPQASAPAFTPPAPAPQPAAQPAAQPPPESPAESDDGETNPRLVLIATPDSDNAKRWVETVRGWGLEAESAHDGVEAILKIHRLWPAAVVLDPQLPKMFGFQVCEVIKRNESLRGIGVVLIGAIHHPDRYRRTPSELYGADAYAEEPDMPDALAPILRDLGLPMGPAGPSAVPEAPAPAPDAPTLPPPVPPEATLPPMPPPAAAEPVAAPAVAEEITLPPVEALAPEPVPEPAPQPAPVAEPAPIASPEYDVIDPDAVPAAAVAEPEWSPPPAAEPVAPPMPEPMSAVPEPVQAAPEPPMPEPAPAPMPEPVAAAPEPAPMPEPVAVAPEPVAAPAPPQPVAEPAPAPAPEPAGADPETEQAERLARIIISDVVLYNEDKFRAACEAGNVLEAMEQDLADGRAHFASRVPEHVRNARDFLADELMRLARARGLV